LMIEPEAGNQHDRRSGPKILHMDPHFVVDLDECHLWSTFRIGFMILSVLIILENPANARRSGERRWPGERDGHTEPRGAGAGAVARSRRRPHVAHAVDQVARKLLWVRVGLEREEIHYELQDQQQRTAPADHGKQAPGPA